MVVIFIDVTRLTEAEAHHQVLIAELNHRAKNMLAVVISIVRQTMRQSPSLEAFQAALAGHLHSMARSYELLSRENWTEPSIEELVRQELDPFGLERIAFAGPTVLLEPEHALAIGMILHELATNAAKHRGLSTPKGRLEVNWTLSEETGRLALVWIEHNGPSIEAPPERGFGLTLAEREVKPRFGGTGGTVEISVEPGGLAFELGLPLGEPGRRRKLAAPRGWRGPQPRPVVAGGG